MTEKIGLQRGNKVLEIGTGSGYQAAVLAHLGVEVYSVEIIPELAQGHKVPDLVAAKDRKGLRSRDVGAVLTKVVQEQQKTIEELRKEMAELKKKAKSER